MLVDGGAPRVGGRQRRRQAEAAAEAAAHPSLLIFCYIVVAEQAERSLPGLRWYVQISIGNKLWGPLNWKKGGKAPRAMDLL
jgi:hypothetical protein